MKLENLEIYQLSMAIAESIWEIISNWNGFAKNTLGNQLIRSSDSIAANISEGFGRYSYKENKLFCYYARGSLFETKTWIIKTNNRELISNKELQTLNKELNNLGVKLNNYIKSIGNPPQKKQ